MAAEYEAIIASLKKKDNKGGKGNTGRRKKPNTETYATKEEAIAALEEAQKKVLAMTDLAFGGGGEKITTYSGAYPFRIPGLQLAVRRVIIGTF